MAGNRGPTPSQRDQQRQQIADVEVVNAAGERKSASLPQRIGAKIRDTVSMTDELPTWRPGELADDAPILPVPAVSMDPHAFVDRDGVHCDWCNKPDDDPIHADFKPQQPPKALQLAYRQQHEANTQRVADQTAVRTSQLVDMDRKARGRVNDIGRLVALAALGNQAAAQLQNDGWALVDSGLIGEFAAEVDGWKQDRGIS